MIYIRQLGVPSWDHNNMHDDNNNKQYYIIVFFIYFHTTWMQYNNYNNMLLSINSYLYDGQIKIQILKI